MARKKRPWSLLSSHGLVLVTVARYGDLAVPDISQKTGLSRSTVLNVLKDLRRNTYNIDTSKTLRHPIVRDTDLGDLLGAFGPVKS